MKAIIEGKRYDTDKATMIGEAGYGGSMSDFQWWEAGLYFTGNTYFLAGKGGPLSRFAKPVDGGGTSDGEGIKPLTKHEALDWAEQYLPFETVEEFFGGSITDA